MFHQKFTPSKAGDKCDECGTGLILRKDDSAEVIRERLQVYHKTTKPLIQYYKNLDAYAEVDGAKGVDEIFESIVKIIKAH